MGAKTAFIVYASVLHLVWAIVLLFFPNAIRSSYMQILLFIFHSQAVIILFLVAAAVIALFGVIYYNERRDFSICLLAPQQFLLWTTAFGATNALIVGMPGIDTERLVVGFTPVILLAPIYTFSVFECSRGLSWSKHWPGQSH